MRDARTNLTGVAACESNAKRTHTVLLFYIATSPIHDATSPLLLHGERRATQMVSTAASAALQCGSLWCRNGPGGQTLSAFDACCSWSYGGALPELLDSRQ
eukprot:6190578-Pleurochrysis_carterae.AAC.1